MDPGRCGVDRSVLCRLCLAPEERKRGSSGLCAVGASRRTSRRYFKGRQLEEREREISTSASGGISGTVDWFHRLCAAIRVHPRMGHVRDHADVGALLGHLVGRDMLVLRLEAITTLVVYRRGAHV